MPRNPRSTNRPTRTTWLAVVVGMAIMLVAVILYSVLVIGPTFSSCVEELERADEGALSWSFTPWSGFRCNVDI